MEKFTLITDNTQETLSKALNISEERREKLAASLQQHINNPDEPSVSESLSKVVADCNTLEEVVYAAFTFGEHVGEGAGEYCMHALLAAMGTGAIAGGSNDEEENL